MTTYYGWTTPQRWVSVCVSVLAVYAMPDGPWYRKLAALVIANVAYSINIRERSDG